MLCQTHYPSGNGETLSPPFYPFRQLQWSAVNRALCRWISTDALIQNILLSTGESDQDGDLPSYTLLQTFYLSVQLQADPGNDPSKQQMINQFARFCPLYTGPLKPLLVFHIGLCYLKVQNRDHAWPVPIAVSRLHRCTSLFFSFLPELRESTTCAPYTTYTWGLPRR